MNDNKGVKIDVFGTIKDTTSQALGGMLVMAIVAVTIGMLFAPWFAGFFEPYLRTKYNVYKYPQNYVVVRQKLNQIRFVLWIVAILSWFWLAVENKWIKF